MLGVQVTLMMMFPCASILARPVHMVSTSLRGAMRGSSAATSIFASSRSILALSSCLGVSQRGPRICRSEKM